MVSLIEYICGFFYGYNKKKRLVKKLRKESGISYTEAMEQLGVYMLQYKTLFKSLKIHLITIIGWQIMSYTGLFTLAGVTLLICVTDLAPIKLLAISTIAGIVGGLNALKTAVLIEREDRLLDGLEKLI